MRLLAGLMLSLAFAQGQTVEVDRLFPPAALDGEWRQQAGDDPRWAESSFDDSAWARVAMPAKVNEQFGWR